LDTEKAAAYMTSKHRTRPIFQKLSSHDGIFNLWGQNECGSIQLR